jgi:hypothetical protein
MSNVVQAEEFLRFFSMKPHTLLCYRTDGTVCIQRLGDYDCRLHATKKTDVTVEAWMDQSRKAVHQMPAWVREVTALPTVEDLEEWVEGCGVCETPTGHCVEPDGEGPDGVPSWLLCLGLI